MTKEKIIEYLYENNVRGDLTIEQMAEALDRPQGEWVGYNADKEDWLRTDGTPIFLVCGKCHETVMSNASAHWNFCPNCGARMKGANDDRL